MRGGSKNALLRWERFRKEGLSQYAARRNSAMQRWAALPALGPSPFLPLLCLCFSRQGACRPPPPGSILFLPVSRSV